MNMRSQGSESRLAKLQMRYQQKQKEELERKRNELLATRSLIPTLDLEENKIHIGNGKVRQMFDERRQKSTGIDKSYPLQPISSRATSNHSNSHSQNMATNSTTFNRFSRNGVAYVPSDNDYIENEQTPDVFSQLDIIDSLDSGRYGMNNVEKQMANLNLVVTSSSGKLRPVITRKSMGQSSPNSLNTLKKLPSQPIQSKPRSTPSSPEKAGAKQRISKTRPAVGTTKKPMSNSVEAGSSSSSARSSATSNSSAKVQHGPPPDGMTTCDICGRNFNDDRIAKHKTICEKAMTKKRKVFDATKHRVKGTEAEMYVKKATRTVSKKEPAPPKSNWRRKHEEFIEAIRSAKKVQQHLANGGKLSDLPPPPPSDNSDYIKCPHCQRRFNQTAAERHIPKCATFQFNKPKANASVTKARR